MRTTIALVTVLIVTQLAIAGGIVTNTNQSAQFIRTLSRNASTEIDATYFNPAGLTQLEDGFHIAFYNQIIDQEKKVKNSFPLLNSQEYVGTVEVPLFPNFYASYKKDNWAIAFGFGPNGGGGTAEFATGLPSFEMPISLLPANVSMSGIPTTAYRATINFDGSSVYYGFQLNAAYALNEVVSVSLGGRYISAVNTYEGAIQNILINPIYPPAQLTGNFIPATQFFSMIGMAEQAARVSDKAVDVKQTATGITPIIGLNFKPTETLNVGLKYEMNTALEFTNETTKDDLGQFPDGYTFRNDIPAILTCGMEYAFFPRFRGSFSFNTYFDKMADWEGRENLVRKNLNEFSFGFEFDVAKALLISAGYLRSSTGVKDIYQTDISHSLSSDTGGIGLRYTLANLIDIDLGALYTIYKESDRDGVQMDSGIPYVETYNRSNIAFAVGLGVHF
ncbi:hypothetical protein EH223_19485 [candidate division KSB1 bacterium]|nr:outer membrane protein transport protein [candidate division KSB1 bacterium]RQW00129.1 MAG: hypothetical protein EH223_19485 [candidate division KSB1 bacterium]